MAIRKAISLQVSSPPPIASPRREAMAGRIGHVARQSVRFSATFLNRNACPQEASNGLSPGALFPQGRALCCDFLS